jgi:hypothetical protein
MSYSFDGPQRLCILGPGTTVLDVADMYSRWKEWLAIDDNSKFLPFMSVVGGDTTVGSNAIASYFFVQNGWRVRPSEAHHTLTVDGILNGQDGAEIFADTIGAWRVRIVQVVPLQAETVTVDSGGGTGGAGLSSAQVAAAVLNAPAENHNLPGTIGRLLNTMLTVARFVGLR